MKFKRLDFKEWGWAVTPYWFENEWLYDVEVNGLPTRLMSEREFDVFIKLIGGYRV